MVTFICLFFPSVFSVFLFEEITNKKLSPRKTVYLFVTNVMVINFIVFAFKHLVLDSAQTSLRMGDDITVQGAMNYLLMAVPVAVVAAVLLAFLSKRIRLNIR